jgi:phosphoglycerate dehydrogenase-like enzyme
MSLPQDKDAACMKELTVMGKVLITTRSVANCSKAVEMLSNAGHEVVVHIGKGDMGEEEFCDVIHGADALIVGVDQVSRRVIEAGIPTLKIIARNGVGYNNVDLGFARKNGIPVTIAPNASKISVCELTLGMMFSAARSICQQNQVIKNHGWQRLMGFEILGKTLGIIGCGNIGAEVAARTAALGMNVLLNDICESQKIKEISGVRYTDLAELLECADVITLHLPVTDSTRGLVDKAFLEKTKTGVVLINTARGLLINDRDVANALSSGKLACYATDTLSEEPASLDNSIVNAPNSIVTPHCGAYTAEAVERCGIMVAEEVNRVMRGEALLYNVTK